MEGWDIALLRMLPPPCVLSVHGANVVALIDWADAARPILRLRAASRGLQQCVAPHFDSQDCALHFSALHFRFSGRGIEQAYQEYVAEQHRELDAFYAD